jgi:hypothetical protein
MEYRTLNLDDIIDYCKEHKQVPWLKAIAAQENKGKKISFIELKLAFCRQFMPEILPAAKPKKPSMYDRIANL